MAYESLVLWVLQKLGLILSFKEIEIIESRNIFEGEHGLAIHIREERITVSPP